MYKNIEDKRANQREHYKKNKGSYNKRSKSRKIKIKDWVEKEYKKDKKCSKCPENDIRCLDFHHRDKTIKEFSIAKMYGFSKEIIIKEIEKCDILCANCHRKLHWEEEKGVFSPTEETLVLETKK